MSRSNTNFVIYEDSDARRSSVETSSHEDNDGSIHEDSNGGDHSDKGYSRDVSAYADTEDLNPDSEEYQQRLAYNEYREARDEETERAARATAAWVEETAGQSREAQDSNGEAPGSYAASPTSDRSSVNQATTDAQDHSVTSDHSAMPATQSSAAASNDQADVTALATTAPITQDAETSADQAMNATAPSRSPSPISAVHSDPLADVTAMNNVALTGTLLTDNPAVDEMAAADVNTTDLFIVRLRDRIHLDFADIAAIINDELACHSLGPTGPITTEGVSSRYTRTSSQLVIVATAEDVRARAERKESSKRKRGSEGSKGSKDSADGDGADRAKAVKLLK